LPVPLAAFRTIVHVDMDAFFTSVEIRDQPKLKGKPIVVGADPKGGSGRGVISAASYEARRFGVKSAQPVSTAYKLCPEAIFLPHRIERYREVSNEVMEILSTFSDLLLRASIDEAVLDCSDNAGGFKSWKHLGQAIKDKVRHETTLTCSLGIATGTTIAKMASEFQKPDGLTLVLPGREAAFLAPMAVETIPGIGPRARESLNRLGLRTIADVQGAEPLVLATALGSWGKRIFDLAHGSDNDELILGEARKSFGEERTYATDLETIEAAEAALREIADDLALRMSRKNISGRTLTLKARAADFHTITRSRTLPIPVRSAPALFEHAWQLFQQHVSPEKLKHEKIRLLGIQMSKLYAAKPGEQLWLF
jgi:nucleotidyltransferase/DNA polymerase involved in DNA repair